MDVQEMLRENKEKTKKEVIALIQKEGSLNNVYIKISNQLLDCFVSNFKNIYKDFEEWSVFINHDFRNIINKDNLHENILISLYLIFNNIMFEITNTPLYRLEATIKENYFALNEKLYDLNTQGHMLVEEERVANEIIDKILEEEKILDLNRSEIIKNGCPHTNKTEQIATLSKIHFLQCDVCFKQFDLDGNPLEY